MKTIFPLLCVALLCFVQPSVAVEPQPIWIGGLVIKFKEGSPETLKRESIEGALTAEEARILKITFLHDITITTLDKGKYEINTERFTQIKTELELLESVEFVNAFMVNKEGSYAASLGEFYVKLKSTSDLEKLQLFAHKTATRIVEPYEYMHNVYVLYADKHSQGNSSEMADLFSSTGLFRYASANSLFSLSATTNDFFFDWQWAIVNEGTGAQFLGTVDADMDVDSAWTITTGDSTIKIAVLDSGTDTLHPDLIPNLLPGFDGVGDTLKGHPATNFSEDGHGTCCAGIVAAVADNTIGTAGVAPTCKIIPVRIFFYIDLTGPVTPYTTMQYGMDGLNYAYQTAAADVISNSWGIPDDQISQFSLDTVIANDIIAIASDSGRGGKGVPMVFSAGNEPDSMTIWPSNLSGTIAVAATTMCDELKTASDCSPENWSSNHGKDLDVSAPGVKIATSDMLGNFGFASGEYYLSFNGTSAACPNTAGVIALMLSVNNNLTGGQAREVLSRSCEKVGGYDYDENKVYGAWSTELGYGRVNAHRAVQDAANFVEVQESSPGNTLEMLVSQDAGGFNYLRYHLTVPSDVEISIYDMLGRVILSRRIAGQQIGYHSTLLNPKLVASQVCVVRLTVDHSQVDSQSALFTSYKK